MKLKGEDQEQATLIQYANLQSDPRWALLFSIPNGGRRHYKTAVKMKLTGLKPGIPDLFLPAPSAPAHGLFIEMKSEKGKVQPNQKVWIRELREQGYSVEVCYGTVEAIDVIHRYLQGYFAPASTAVLRSPPGGTQI